MSVEFEIKITQKSEDLSVLLSTWIETQAFDPPPSVEIHDDGLAAFLFQPGASLRGWILKDQTGTMDGNLNLRLNACASLGDWQTAFSFFQYVLAAGGQVWDAEGHNICPDQVSEGEAKRRGWREWEVGVAVLRKVLHARHEDYVALPTSYMKTSVDQGDIPDREMTQAELTQLHDSLVDKAKRYAIAHRAEVIELANGSTLLAWAGLGTLTRSADFILFPVDASNPRGVSRFLPWADVLEFLGERIEIIKGQRSEFYFPNIDWAETSDKRTWDALVARSRAAEELMG